MDIEEITNEKKPIRVYSDGIFDLFHFGHMRMLEQVRKQFPTAEIVVGVCSDADTHKYKGVTVMPMQERAESLRHCKWVDEIIKDSPWIITKEFLTENRIDWVAHDGDLYTTDGHEDAYAEVKKLGVFVETQRTEGISTSEIISRVLREYELFLRRNIIRGATSKDLNISKFKEKRIKLSAHLEGKLVKLRRKMKDISDVWESAACEIKKKFVEVFM
ncbi:choline-phosphate cytidylyltransferase [Nematocida ausubeli]|nr:choline-phosphate cytidylyltransferase [Nematocida ausubeli]KAI5160920.1 choline-phosphate cytidylyltransferase [Nematocida ausubeli]